MRLALAAVAAALLLAHPASAQEEEPARVVESEVDDDIEPPPEDRPAEPTRTPVQESAEPEAEAPSRVVGQRRPAAPKPPPPKAKPRAPVKRDAEGKVIIPRTPRTMMDPLRPRTTHVAGVTRATLTARQLLAAAVPGCCVLGCAGLATPPYLCLSVLFSPVAAVPAGGLWWGGFALMHAVATSLLLWLPVLGAERDVLPALAAAGAVIAFDALTVLGGGIAALAIALRWAPAPSSATVTDRIGLARFIGLPPIYELRGTDVALALSFLATVAVAAFVAPFVGVVAYLGVDWLRGTVEEDEFQKRRMLQDAARAAPGRSEKAKPQGGTR